MPLETQGVLEKRIQNILWRVGSPRFPGQLNPASVASRLRDGHARTLGLLFSTAHQANDTFSEAEHRLLPHVFTLVHRFFAAARGAVVMFGPDPERPAVHLGGRSSLASTVPIDVVMSVWPLSSSSSVARSASCATDGSVRGERVRWPRWRGQQISAYARDRWS